MLNICSSHCFSIQRQDIAVVTKWLSGVSPEKGVCRFDLSASSSASPNRTTTLISPRAVPHSHLSTRHLVLPSTTIPISTNASSSTKFPTFSPLPLSNPRTLFRNPSNRRNRTRNWWTRFCPPKINCGESSSRS